MTIIYACNRLADLPQCRAAGCAGRATYKCEFPLRGKKAGQTCDRPLCRPHAVLKGDKSYCEGHARLLERDEQ